MINEISGSDYSDQDLLSLSVSVFPGICWWGCLNIYGTHVTANNSTNNNVVFFFVSDLKIVYYNNY